MNIWGCRAQRTQREECARVNAKREAATTITQFQAESAVFSTRCSDGGSENFVPADEILHDDSQSAGDAVLDDVGIVR